MPTADSNTSADVSTEEAWRLAEELFGVKVEGCQQLPGYEDKNFRITCSFKTTPSWYSESNACLTQREFYVLKVANSYDSSPTMRRIIEAQNELMLFLSANGLPVQRPVPIRTAVVASLSAPDSYYVMRTISKLAERAETIPNSRNADENGKPREIENQEHLVRLLTFVPGEVMLRMQPTTFNIFFETGKFLSKFHRVMRTFHNDALERNCGLWNLETVSSLLRDYTTALDSPWKRAIVDETIARFVALEPLFTHFRRGWVHGDPNEQNVLVDIHADTVCGLLDFQDTRVSYIAFDVALLLCYMMFLDTRALQLLARATLESHESVSDVIAAVEGEGQPEGDFVSDRLDMDVAAAKLVLGGHLLAGYLSELDTEGAANHEPALNCIEFDCLPELVAARFAQSLTLGEFTHRRIQPDNDYVLSTALKGGWHFLRLLHVLPSAKITALWRHIIASYGVHKPQ